MVNKIESQSKQARMKQRKVLVVGVAIGLIALISGVVYEAKATKLFILPELNSNSIDTYPPGKRDVLLRVEQQIEDARAHATPQPTLAHPEIPPAHPIVPNKIALQPSPTPMAGIFNGGGDAFHSMEFTTRNMWEGSVNQTWEYVYAGGTPKDPQSGSSTPGPGAVWIFTGSIGDNLKKFPAPTGYSPLTITAVNGTIMQLRSDSGQTLTFNLATHQYK